MLLNYCQAEEKFRPLIKSCLDDFAANAEKIDSAKDSEYIVEELKTGYHPPEDIPFEGESSKQILVVRTVHILHAIF